MRFLTRAGSGKPVAPSCSAAMRFCSSVKTVLFSRVCTGTTAQFEPSVSSGTRAKYEDDEGSDVVVVGAT